MRFFPETIRTAPDKSDRAARVSAAGGEIQGFGPNPQTEAMMAILAERADADVYRMKDGDKIVGFAIRLSNGVWRQFGSDMAAPLNKKDFATPKAAAKAFPTAS